MAIIVKACMIPFAIPSCSVPTIDLMMLYLAGE